MGQSLSTVEKPPPIAQKCPPMIREMPQSAMNQSQVTVDQSQCYMPSTVQTQPTMEKRGSSIPADDPPSWINPYCYSGGDAATCCLGCWCPGMLYGKTQNRLRSIHMGQDPLAENYPLCNLPCWMYSCVGLFGVPSGLCVCTQHNRIRETYNIEGTWQRDLAKSCCCWCSLVQADREVRSRAALDEKNAKNGIFTLPYNTNNQRMRYVPPDILLGDSIDNLRSGSKPSQKAIDVESGNIQQDHSPAFNKATTAQTDLLAVDGTTTPRNDLLVLDGAGSPQDNLPAIVSLDGATVVETIELKTFKGRVTRKLSSKASQAVGTVRRASHTKTENTPPSDKKVEFISNCENHGIVVENSGQTANQRSLTSSHAGTSDQRGGDDGKTIAHKEEPGSNYTLKSKKGGHFVNGGNDETVFVYYNSPTTPEPQKLRDCLKTNTSESTTDCNASRVNKGGRSSTDDSDSCAADERLSFEEPSIRGSIQVMLSIDDGHAASSIPTVPIEYKQSAQLPSITECSQSSQSGSNPQASEETIKNVRKGSPNLSLSAPTDIQASNEGDDQVVIVPLHPLTRDSIIMPCTPLALEEVAEEIDVDGEWKVPQEGKAGAMTVGWKYGRKVRPSFFDGNSEP